MKQSKTSDKKPTAIVSPFRLPHRERSLAATIAEFIGGSIVTGELPPGTDLNTVELARRFDTSRTPIREALLLLEKEGLVEIPPRRRPHVAAVPLKDILEIYRIRELLLVDVVDQVITNATDEELAGLLPLWKSMDAFRRRDELSEAFWAMAQFFDRFVELSRNRTLKAILDRLKLQSARVRYAVFLLPGNAERTIEAHRALSQALEDRNSPLAKGLIQSILQQARISVETGKVSMALEYPEPVRHRRKKRRAKLSPVPGEKAKSNARSKLSQDRGRQDGPLPQGKQVQTMPRVNSKRSAQRQAHRD